MTTGQQETYERMLAQAKRDLLEVRGHGTVKATGAAVYAVQSKTESNRLHLASGAGAGAARAGGLGAARRPGA